MNSKSLNWYIQDQERLEGYIAVIRRCGTLDEILEQVVKPMLVDGNSRINTNTISKKAFFNALKPYFGTLSGGTSLDSYYRHCNEMIGKMSKVEKHRTLQMSLPSKAKGKIDILAPQPEKGEEGHIRLVIEIPLKDTGKLTLSSGFYELDLKEIIIRGFEAPYTDNTMCRYDLQGTASSIADALTCFSALSEEEGDRQVRIHYIYRNIDRTGLTLTQAILMARHASNKQA